MSLLEIKNLHTCTNDEDKKEILKGINLNINSGEIHVIMGPNGSGKTTLANTIMGNNKYLIEDGSIYFENEDISNLKTNEIARKGIFMSFQLPEEIPGITVSQFLRSVMSNKNEKLNLFKFAESLEDNMKKLNIDTSYMNRELNVGFSGGEKKKNEILQMLMINPKLAILDETDSGLDVDAIDIVSKGIQMFKNDNNSILIITHSTKILKYLDVDYVHILANGKIVLSGDKSLAKKIEENGYSSYLE